MKRFKILVINPGSTSTKIAVFENAEEKFTTTIRHSCDELDIFDKISDQFSFRKEVIINELFRNSIDVNDLDAVIGRGGLVKPVSGGVYEVNDALIADLQKGVMGQHASNLGGLIAKDIAMTLDSVKAYIADPVVVDELQDIARVAGHPDFERVSIFHALNQKAVAKNYAESVNEKYEDLNLIVAHMGGGISVGAHKEGRVIDVNNAVDGDGPFSPERSGSLPTGQLVEMCFSGKYTQSEVKKVLCGKGGVSAYMNTGMVSEVVAKAKAGDKKAELIYKAMAYQVAKSIGEMATVLHGNVHAVLITGGITYNTEVTDYIKKMIEFIAPVFIYQGEDEMLALATNGLSVLQGEEECRIYS